MEFGTEKFTAVAQICTATIRLVTVNFINQAGKAYVPPRLATWAFGPENKERNYSVVFQECFGIIDENLAILDSDYSRLNKK